MFHLMSVKLLTSSLTVLFVLYASISVNHGQPMGVDPLQLINWLNHSGSRLFRDDKSIWQKRGPGSEFLGKRIPGSEFLGKRIPGSEFLGKRMGSEFLGKRTLGSEFLGKRVPASIFLSERAPGSEFLGKRIPGSEFLGKRSEYGYHFVTNDDSHLNNKRSPEMEQPTLQSERDKSHYLGKPLKA